MRSRRLAFAHPAQVSVAVAGAIVAVLVGACTPDAGSEATPSDPCRATIDEAGAAAELREQVDLLDRALVICATPEVFAVNVQRHPTLLGWDVETYLSNRCRTVEDESVRRSRICTSEQVTPTTSPVVAAPEVVYVGTTLDGREIEIRPRAGRPFEDGRPRVLVEMAEIARRLGCDGIEAEYVRWIEQIDDPLIGDEVSVYAQHALDVLAFIQCDPPDTAVGDGD